MGLPVLELTAVRRGFSISIEEEEKDKMIYVALFIEEDLELIPNH